MQLLVIAVLMLSYCELAANPLIGKVAENQKLSVSVNAPCLSKLNTCDFGFSSHVVLGLSNESAKSVKISTTVSGGTPPYSFSWTGDGASMLSNTAEQNPVFSPEGTQVSPHPACMVYKLTVTVKDATGQASANISINVVNAGAGEKNVPKPCSEEKKINICHVPAASPANRSTVCVAPNLVSTHGFDGLEGPGGSDASHRLDCIGSCVKSSCEKPKQASAMQMLMDEDLESGSVLENFPDPFVDKTTIRFIVEEDMTVALNLFDLSGQLVKTIFSGKVSPNQDYRYEINGKAMPSGVYVYKLETPAGTQSGKMLLLKD